MMVVWSHIAQAYVRLREQGESDMGSILLGVAAELQSFDYGETFTGAFEACPAHV